MQVKPAHRAANNDRSRTANVLQLMVWLALMGIALATMAVAVTVGLLMQLAAASH